MRIQDIKQNLTFTWEKGYLLIAYFLLLSILNYILPYDWLFIIFAWPLYIIPNTFIAGILELLYAYIICVIISLLLQNIGKKK